MSDPPLVSIVITSYNYGRFLGAAIDSALNQTHPAVEVIVVDDGSTDDSQEVIAGYGDRILPVLRENGGEASAFNAGVAASKGSIVCFLDSDDIFVPEKVTRVIEVFARHLQIGSCFHTLRALNETDTDASFACIAPTGEHDYRARARHGEMPVIASAMSGMCFRRTLLNTIAPIPELKRSAIGEHYIKWTALALQPTYFLDELLALRRVHGDNSYTARATNVVKARHHIVQACWMREQFPDLLARWADKVFANGLGIYWQAGSVEADLRERVQCYLASVSPFARAKIMLYALYHWSSAGEYIQHLHRVLPLAKAD